MPVVQISPEESWEQRIREAILQQLPLGAARPQIEAFIRKNFVRLGYAVTTTDDARALAHPTDRHVFIRAVDHTGFSGTCRVEIYLILTPDERLKDVIVRAQEAYV